VQLLFVCAVSFLLLSMERDVHNRTDVLSTHVFKVIVEYGFLVA